MYLSLLLKMASFGSYLSLKIGKKAKNACSGHIYDVTAFSGAPKNLKKVRGTHGLPRKIFRRLKKNFIFFLRTISPRTGYIYIYIYSWFSVKSRGQKMNLLKTLRKCSTTYSGYLWIFSDFLRGWCPIPAKFSAVPATVFSINL